LPRWLDRALPDLDVEGEHLIEALEAEEAEEAASVEEAALGAIPDDQPVSV
jgi:hypothetical protein